MSPPQPNIETKRPLHGQKKPATTSVFTNPIPLRARAAPLLEGAVPTSEAPELAGAAVEALPTPTPMGTPPPTPTPMGAPPLASGGDGPTLDEDGNTGGTDDGTAIFVDVVAGPGTVAGTVGTVASVDVDVTGACSVGVGVGVGVGAGGGVGIGVDVGCAAGVFVVGAGGFDGLTEATVKALIVCPAVWQLETRAGIRKNAGQYNARCSQHSSRSAVVTPLKYRAA
ncbi:hypothetical protein C8R46DRAFT_1309341 [Mycena filopes]|nr:hypothetical protein C8R46DRAFT_1309341 [Mycena filopes]